MSLLGFSCCWSWHSAFVIASLSTFLLSFCCLSLTISFFVLVHEVPYLCKWAFCWNSHSFCKTRWVVPQWSVPGHPSSGQLLSTFCLITWKCRVLTLSLTFPAFSSIQLFLTSWFSTPKLLSLATFATDSPTSESSIPSRALLFVLSRNNLHYVWSRHFLNCSHSPMLPSQQMSQGLKSHMRIKASSQKTSANCLKRAPSTWSDFL